MIIYMGISGSGKGTQCDLLAEQLAYEHLSMSDLIRAYADAKQQEKMRVGVLLDDQDAIEIVQTALKAQANSDKVILDGFPRTPGQAGWLIAQAKAGAFRVEAVINLKLSEEKVLERLLLRGRTDDTPRVIKSRFEWYGSNVVPAIDYFRRSAVPVYDIEGDGTPEAVFKATVDQLRAAAVVS